MRILDDEQVEIVGDIEMGREANVMILFQTKS